MSSFHHIPSRCHEKTLLLILHFPGRSLASPVHLFSFVWVTGQVLQLLLTGESEGTHRSETKFLGIRMRRRQCVAHSGVRAAEQRNSWVCAKKATRSPQRRTRRIATKFIDPCLPRDAILSLYWFYWLRTLYVIQ